MKVFPETELYFKGLSRAGENSYTIVVGRYTYMFLAKNYSFMTRYLDKLFNKTIKPGEENEVAMDANKINEKTAKKSKGELLETVIFGPVTKKLENGKSKSLGELFPYLIGTKFETETVEDGFIEIKNFPKVMKSNEGKKNQTKPMNPSFFENFDLKKLPNQCLIEDAVKILSKLLKTDDNYLIYMQPLSSSADFIAIINHKILEIQCKNLTKSKKLRNGKKKKDSLFNLATLSKEIKKSTITKDNEGVLVVFATEYDEIMKSIVDCDVVLKPTAPVFLVDRRLLQKGVGVYGNGGKQKYTEQDDDLLEKFKPRITEGEINEGMEIVLISRESFRKCGKIFKVNEKTKQIEEMDALEFVEMMKKEEETSGNLNLTGELLYQSEMIEFYNLKNGGLSSFFFVLDINSFFIYIYYSFAQMIILL